MARTEENNWLLDRFPRRIYWRKARGCYFWKDEKACNFPVCFCYPEWQWEKKQNCKVVNIKEKPSGSF